MSPMYKEIHQTWEFFSCLKPNNYTKRERNQLRHDIKELVSAFVVWTISGPTNCDFLGGATSNSTVARPLLYNGPAKNMHKHHQAVFAMVFK